MYDKIIALVLLFVMADIFKIINIVPFIVALMDAKISKKEKLPLNEYKWKIIEDVLI